MSKRKLTAANCPSCGGDLKIEKGTENALCEYCGTTVLIDDTETGPKSAKKPIKVAIDFRRLFTGFGCLVILIFVVTFAVILAFMGFIGVLSGLLAHILGKLGF